SAEARGYLEKLQSDSRRLKALPRKTLRPDFPQKVLQTISEHGMRPRRTIPVQPKPARFLPVWAGVAAAASVLLMVGAGSYVYFPQTFSQVLPSPSVAKGGTADANTGPQPDGVSGLPTPDPDGGSSGPEQPGMKKPWFPFNNPVAQGTNQDPQNPSGLA